MNGYDNGNRRTPKSGRIVFGILMILVYIGVGLLFFFNVFRIDSAALSYVIGGILCAYGVWRGIRLYNGWG